MATKLLLQYEINRQQQFLSLTVGMNITASSLENQRHYNAVVAELTPYHTFITSLTEDAKLLRLFRVTEFTDPSNRKPQLEMMLVLVGNYNEQGELTLITLLPSP